MKQAVIPQVESQTSREPELLEVDLNKIPSVVLQRLIEEVRNEDDESRAGSLYNRWHNRHNRSR